mgnify:CR=1 FL=1
MPMGPGTYGSKKGRPPAKKKKGVAKKAMTFGQKFNERKKAGVATFMYKGKSYSTKTKEEVTKKATRAQSKAIKKKSRLGKTTRTSKGKGMTSTKTKTTMRQRMAARKKGRVAARKNRRLNKSLRK